MQLSHSRCFESGLSAFGVERGKSGLSTNEDAVILDAIRDATSDLVFEKTYFE